MGAPQSEPFPPLPSRLGVNSRFLSDGPTVLVMQEHFSWSGGDYSVHTDDGREVIRCSGKAMSLSQRKEFQTPEGEPLYTLRNETFSIPRSYFLEGPHGEHFLTLDSHVSFLSGPKLDATFKNLLGGGEDVTLEIRGSFSGRKCDITWDDRVVARVRREFGGFRQVFGPGTYGVEVAGGVDLGLISAVIIGLEEYREDRRHN